MRKNLILLFSAFCLLTVPSRSFAQKMGNEDKDMQTHAEFLVKKGKYMLALPLYLKLTEKFPTNIDFKYELGKLYLYKNDEHAKAVPLLEEVLKAKPKTPNIHFELGRAYHLSMEFDKATEEFNKFLKKKPSADLKKQTEHYLENCRYGKELVAKPDSVKITNLGDDVNGSFSEYVPAISSDESVMIFTYRGDRSTGGLMNDYYEPDPDGDYFEDVFVTYRVGGNFLTPERIGTNINGFGHDASVSISPSGQKLFLYIATPEDGGDLFVAYLDGEYWTAPERILGEVNSKSWEGSCSISADEKTLYFASERPGGLGGKDIYKATLKSDGTWGNVENLGPNVNTIYDDDAPFIHPDGTMLHFSSKGHNSMGGFDIFRSDIGEDGKWMKANNLGYPLNTPDDDIYYTLSADGKTGYFSSGRPGGHGGQDIFMVTPGLKHHAPTKTLMTKGIVTLNDTGFVESQIEVYEAKDPTKIIGSFESNSKTGKYLLNLQVGQAYKVVFKYKDLDPITKELNYAAIDSFVEADIDIKFYTRDFKKAEPPKADTAAVAQAKNAAPPANTPPSNVNVAKYKDMPYDEVAKKYLNDQMDGLEFRVQIAAYRLSENFSYSKLLSLGTVEKNKWDDGVTRFTIGKFSKLGDAEDFRKKVIEAGVKDAFVYATFKGKRMFVWELPTLFGER